MANMRRRKDQIRQFKSEEIHQPGFSCLLKSLFVLCLFCLVVAGSIGFGMVKGIIDNAPDVDIATIVPNEYATTVYDSAGNVTETLVTAGSNREEASYDELPKNLINAFVAYEDARFWEHNGIDLRSIMRAVKGVLTGDSSAGGGSTITQQLIKNSVFGGEWKKLRGTAGTEDAGMVSGRQTGQRHVKRADHYQLLKHDQPGKEFSGRQGSGKEIF